MSKMNELLTSSFFGNGYVTLLDVEIKDYICKHKKSSRNAFIDNFAQCGYSPDDIAEELDRQCYCSTLRHIPEEDTYAGIHIGMNLWHDICARIHDQKSIVAGQLQYKDSRIQVDIFRTDLQPATLKKKARALGLHRAPVMRWTGKFTEKDALKYLGYLLDVVPFTVFHDREDLSGVLRMIDDVISSKSDRRPWAWLITHPVVQLELNPSRENVLHSMLLLSKRPMDWKGSPVSLYELKQYTDLPYEEIEEAVEYLEKKGIIRRIGDDFTPTGQGYTLMRHVSKSHVSVTFAVIRRTYKNYQLEISTPSFLCPDIRDLLSESGSIFSLEFRTPAVFSPREKDEILGLIEKIIGKMSDVENI